jgi:hypothetical protein
MNCALGALLRKVILEAAAGIRSAPEAELRDLIVKAALPMPLFNQGFTCRTGNSSLAPTRGGQMPA